METDLAYYTRSLVEARLAARRAATPEARRNYERLANTFAIQVRRVEATPTLVTPEPLRLRPLKMAA